MLAPIETIPAEELAGRRRRCLSILAEREPEAEGLMIFDRVNIYYFTGTLGFGVFWLPREGAPLLMVRKGYERACLESPDTAVARFRSYAELARLIRENGGALPASIAAEQASLPWNLADTLRKHLAGTRFVPADDALSRLRSVKTPWELAKIRLAGARHAEAVAELARQIAPGMSEFAIARLASDIFFSFGSCGIARMNSYSEEMFLGEVSAGFNGNYPTFYNGALGCKGLHPAAPFMGNASSLWEKNSLLAFDSGFCFEGYNSDKTVTFFAGRQDAIPSPARKAHDTCMEIEARITGLMTPGAVPSELYALALGMAEQAGFAEGFMGLGGNKVPFLGHGIGLCIDEWPVLARRFTEPLQAGMVMAVEPKIGLPGLGMTGCENTCEVTENGAVSLSGGSGIVCVE